MNQLTFALYFANRGFFPERLIAGAREDMIQALKQAGYGYIAMDPSATKNGAIETRDEGLQYAKFLKENQGRYD